MGSRRLIDLYQPGELVEITFEGVRWIPAKIVRLQHPGAWVVTAGGALWFVTNGRRIRKLGAAAEEAAE